MYINAPRYLLRKYCILKLIKNLPKGSVLDIGCGAGDLCETLYKIGYKVKGIDYSLEAIQLCQTRTKHLLTDSNISFSTENIEEINETYDIIFICEVLEHIQNDKETLFKIYQRLKRGGHLILSVPAHKSWFGPSDEFVGHYRRYDREELIELLQFSKFCIKKLWSYGVPFANLTEFIRNIIYSRKKTKNRMEATKQSGIERSIESRFHVFINDFFLYPFYLLQMLFKSTDLGTGYIVIALKI